MAMNFTTLAGAKTLAGSIKRQVNYGQIDAEVVLEEAQTLLFQILRVREMRTIWTASLSVGDSYKALPSDFLDPIGKYATDTANLRYRHMLEGDLMARRFYTSGVLQSGQPSIFAIFDEKMQFDFKFDTATTLYLPYFKQPALLAATSNETNFLTTRYPHVLRQACIVRAHAFMKNWTAYNTELPILSALIDTVSSRDDLSRSGADIDTET